MKLTIEIEVDDDFEPCTYGCDICCPLGHYDGDDIPCSHMESDENFEFTCIVNETMKKTKE